MATSAADSNDSRLNCLSCGYNLSGVAVGRKCPECGTPITIHTGTKSGKAIASLVLGICSILLTCIYGFGIIPAVIAIVFWIYAGREAKRGEASPGSLGLARAGGICGIVGGGLSLAIIAATLLFVTTAISNVGNMSQVITTPPPPGVPASAVQTYDANTGTWVWTDPVSGHVYTPTPQPGQGTPLSSSGQTTPNRPGLGPSANEPTSPPTASVTGAGADPETAADSPTPE